MPRPDAIGWAGAGWPGEHRLGEVDPKGRAERGQDGPGPRGQVGGVDHRAAVAAEDLDLLL